MVCLRNMCMATLIKETMVMIIIIIIIIIIHYYFLDLTLQKSLYNFVTKFEERDKSEYKVVQI